MKGFSDEVYELKEATAEDRAREWKEQKQKKTTEKLERKKKTRREIAEARAQKKGL